MDSGLTKQIAAVEDEHWWFVARRRILRRLLTNAGLPETASILEVGCGSGGNLKMLAELGSVTALEPDVQSATIARERQIADVRLGMLPDDAPTGESYDLVAALDVIEHIEEDGSSLVAMGRCLAEDGILLLTVPAYSWMWSEHDVRNAHFRRYTRATLSRLVEAAGYDVLYLSYFNTVMFPLVAVRRLVGPRLGERDDMAMPPPVVNRILTLLFSMEASVVGRLRLPYGVSLVCLATLSRPPEG